MQFLTKTRFMAGLQCRKRLWFEANRPFEAPSQVNVAMMQGRAFDRFVRQSQPGVVIPSHAVLDDAVAATHRVLGEGGKDVLYQATFRSGHLAAVVDVLRRARSSFELVEVKASTKVKPEHLPDVAFQALVLRSAKVPVSAFFVGHVNSAFVLRKPDDYFGLLAEEDVTERVEALLPEVAANAREYTALMRLPSAPVVEMGPQCMRPHECPFVSRCSKERGLVSEYPVEVLPRATGLVRRLRAAGFTDLRSIPADRLTGDFHRRIREATVSGRPYFDPLATRVVRELTFPRAFLDFETLAVSVPDIVGTQPYEQLPFQWSMYVEGASGDIQGFDFLEVEAFGDFEGLTEALLSVLPPEGPVLVYNAPFERGVLVRLARLVPQYAKELSGIVDRLLDLLPVTRSAYYHRDMRGSWSIKSVLPTISPELDFAGLGEVCDAEAAQLAFIEMRSEVTGIGRRQELAKGLREYCQRDTWGMVVLSRFLAGAEIPIGAAQPSGASQRANGETTNAVDSPSAGGSLTHDKAPNALLQALSRLATLLPRHALDNVRIEAEFGDANAQWNMGFSYELGIGVEADEEEAARWFRMAADRGNADAQYRLGMDLAWDFGDDAELAEGALWFRKAADQGHAQAQVALGDLYRYGLGVPADDSLAFPLYEMATRAGLAPAQARVGECYLRGWGVPRDARQAAEWLGKAAQQGDAGAQLALGNLYRRGEGVPRDMAQAARWYQIAAEAGEGEALVRLGTAYRDGEGVPKDVEAALVAYRKAAEMRYPDGMAELGRMYLAGRGVFGDHEDGLRWLREAAAQGSAEGMWTLSRMLRGGWWVAVDEAEATRLHLDAATRGHVGAQVSAGDLYSCGRGVERNLATAVEWYRRAANQDDADGQVSLGVMYRDGAGVTQDYAKALKCFVRAAEQGHAAGQFFLGQMYANGWGLPVDEGHALRWLGLAAAQGHAGAQASLVR